MTERKGRPTRKRKEAQVKPGASLAPAVTKEQKKAQREEARQKRMTQREAFMRGEDHALPARDRGPVRKFVRNCVDARVSIGEFFLPIIFINFAIVALFAKQSPRVINTLVIAMYVLILIGIADGVLLGRRIKKKVAQKFPNEDTKGLAMYAFLRSTQMRRVRAPRPLVERGDKNF